MVDPSFESFNISRNHIELDWIEGTCSGCGTHIVKLAPEPILSGESSREVEQFGKLRESKIQRFCLNHPSRDRQQRFRVWSTKILWKRDRSKILVDLELGRLVRPVEIVSRCSQANFGVFRRFVIVQGVGGVMI